MGNVQPLEGKSTSYMKVFLTLDPHGFSSMATAAINPQEVLWAVLKPNRLQPFSTPSCLAFTAL
jgi:hypothetical protein